MAKLARINYPTGTTTNQIDFTNPLKIDDSFENIAKRSVKFSLSGKQQTAYDYNEEVKTVSITFETSAVRDSLLTFFQDHAGQGKSFDLVEDRVSAPGTTIECYFVGNSFKFEREAKGVDYWKVSFKIRKAK